jgi:hypothetical protein
MGRDFVGVCGQRCTLFRVYGITRVRIQAAYAVYKTGAKTIGYLLAIRV